jgi:hypothetical protein
VAPPAKAIAARRPDFVEAALCGDRGRKIGNQSKIKIAILLRFAPTMPGRGKSPPDYF